MRFLLTLCVVVVLGPACAPDERSYRGVLFVCETTDECPAQDKCVDKLCEPLELGQPGVICGSRACDSDSYCCGPGTFNVCSPTCGAAPAAECDGPEDCSEISPVCCTDGAYASECLEVCPSAEAIVCSHSNNGVDDQCPAAMPACCHRGGSGLKVCSVSCS
ncbi:MAG: hypothetical protein R3B48_14855 [Kofleriaceae bacterium]